MIITLEFSFVKIFDKIFQTMIFLERIKCLNYVFQEYYFAQSFKLILLQNTQENIKLFQISKIQISFSNTIVDRKFKLKTFLFEKHERKIKFHVIVDKILEKKTFKTSKICNPFNIHDTTS